MNFTLSVLIQSIVPGPPFAFGAVLVIMALLVAVFIPENPKKHRSDKGEKSAAADPFELKDDPSGILIKIDSRRLKALE